jgi:spore maturation protein CgeB
MVAVLKEIDLQLCINASVLPRYAELGIRAAYWQIAAEPVDMIPDVPAHDVLLLANAYSAQRKAWGDAVARELGDEYDVAIYGSGWGGRERGQTTYNFAASHALTKNARITIGDNQWEGDGGFVSNRFFEALAVGGALMLHQRVASLQEFTGFTPGQHYVEWTDLPDLFEKARYYLTHEDEARAIAQAGREFSEAWHTFDARVDDLLNVILPEALYEPA